METDKQHFLSDKKNKKNMGTGGQNRCARAAEKDVKTTIQHLLSHLFLPVSFDTAQL